jgi:hypothetical protein
MALSGSYDVVPIYKVLKQMYDEDKAALSAHVHYKSTTNVARKTNVSYKYVMSAIRNQQRYEVSDDDYLSSEDEGNIAPQDSYQDAPTDTCDEMYSDISDTDQSDGSDDQTFDRIYEDAIYRKFSCT